jgi:ABC-type sugar transport system ATPase subunit
MTLAQRMIVMNAGRMEQFGTPEEVYHRPHPPSSPASSVRRR